MAQRELDDSQQKALQVIWDTDISVGETPAGWTLDGFIRKVQNKVFDGYSFKRAVMLVVASVPRPDDPKAMAATKKAELISTLQEKIEAARAARRKK